ncbi:ABC transporter permease [Actinospica robiniae]|uniref:ABC transporter permease n=1 Tax=Actinospica robiniae TaxID=304901 RepID=UPI000688CD75|nr:FtsX-like permease family protein [Actinospica robiniae]
MSPLLRKAARAGAKRRKLQTLILVLVTAGSMACALLAAQLLAGVNGPFDQAFARQHGSELTIHYDAARTSAAQAAATAHTSGVTDSAGPFPTVVLSGYTTTLNTPDLDLADFPLPAMHLVGRAEPGTTVDAVQLTAGHWPSAANQIVIAEGSSPLDGAPMGSTLTFPHSPGSPTLTIVGIADSVSQTADAWVLPQEISTLTPAGAKTGYEMLYRFTSADTASQIAADQKAVTTGLPSGVVTDTESWLTLQSARQSGGTAIIPPFLAAFGVLGVILSVIILASVINATIAASSRRIGILKALGCTPAQVVRMSALQAAIPCVVGVVLGTVVGTIGAVSLLGNTGEALDVGTPSLSTPIEVLVPIGALALVAATAMLAAGRAGRMSVLEALSAGRTPSAGRGRAVQRLLTRTPLPRSVSLGLAAPFTRPARALALTLAVVFGVIAATFAVGVASSLNQATADESDNKGGVLVFIDANKDGPPSAQDSAAAIKAIEAQPGTAAYAATVSFPMSVQGVGEDGTVTEFTGRGSWSYLPIVSGHWLTGPGQAVLPTHLMRVTGLHLGDSITVSEYGEDFPLTIVGEAFDTHQQGMEVLADADTFAAVQHTTPLGSISVQIKPGVDQGSYLSALNRALAPSSSVAVVGTSGGGKLKLIMGALSVMMTLVLVLVAALGVIGSVMLDTRERVHDIGVFKAVGMTPRQTTMMVLTSVLSLGLVAGAIGAPLGMALHAFVMPRMGDAVQANLPSDVLNVYHPVEVVSFALGGVAIALIGALGPAGWAGRLRTAAALRTE